MFFGRTDVEAETPVLWPPDVKSWLIWEDPDAGKDWRREEKGMKEDKMVGWHHWLNGHGFGWSPGVGNGQGGLACCGLWNCKELDVTEWLNWTELIPPSDFWIWRLVSCNNCRNSISLTIPSVSFSVVPFSSCLQSFPVSGSFPVSWRFAPGGQSIGVSASAPVLPMNIQDWFLLGLTGLSSWSPRDS